jgi:uncharacterized circularly permuted ATP-grasp superfamily protein/uncharacterized alpha-E superfamily protein
MTSFLNAPAAAPWRLLDNYDAVPGVYDEMLAMPDVPRSHYERFVTSLESIGRHELASRWENAKRTLRDNGVTYNVYGDPQGTDRRWELDMMPLVISAAEWRRLEAGLVQRTRLLNLLLADIYGPQRVLRDGLLPPEIVLGNPAFLRPCHGVAVPRQVHLHLHAVDLARSPDGRWWVLADRTQAPSGTGYALENRIVLAQSLPEPFRDCRVHRLAPFFGTFRDTLAALAPTASSQPNMVLLTPGPYNETYFEHAYLARYLGLALVEGGDLTVRDRRVFVKTLEGLEPVDVILRRLDDGFCDPLELRADSSLGVPGLTEAVRAGNVVVANALGSGVIENAAILPFLPGLCRSLLGEELRLPSVATWWCGEPWALDHVLDHLDTIVAKRVLASKNREPVFGRVLSEREKTALAAEMRARPTEFVGQEQVALSTGPVWLGTKLEARSLVVRAYIAVADGTFMVMPGGLTRVAGGRGGAVVSMQRGGGSKDTWVLSDGPVSHMTLLAHAETLVRRERRPADTPSRVADNLFWLGRQAERAEHILRLLRTTAVRLPHQDTADESSELTALLKALIRLGLLPAHMSPPMPLRDLEREMFGFFFKRGTQSELRRSLDEVRRLASTMRDRLSADTSRILNQLRQDFPHRHGRIQFVDVLMHLNRLIADFAAFSGMEMENMTRGHGWRFLEVGRRLERAINLTSLSAATVLSEPAEDAMLEPLLEVLDSAITYRRRYFARPSLPFVLDLLLVDTTNARALAFQLEALSAHVQYLPRDTRVPSPTTEERLVARAAETLARADLDALGQGGAGDRIAALKDLLESIRQDLCALSDAITRSYFTHEEQRVS